MLGLHFTPAYVLLLVCSLHCTLSLHFTPGLQSAVRSLRFTLTGFFCWLKPMSFVYVNQLFPLSLPCSAKENFFYCFTR